MKEFTASELTKFALEMLRIQKYRVRRVNNVGAYKKRKFQVEAGWPDIQGYTPGPHSKPVLVEVKKNGDKLSQAQKDRLNDLLCCGGIALICCQIGNNAELINFKDYEK